MSDNNIFRVLADSQRRQILELLKDGDLNAGQISEKLGITPAALSYHLKLLKNAGLTLEYKQGNFVFYKFNISVFDEIIMWVKKFSEAKNNITPENAADNGLVQ